MLGVNLCNCNMCYVKSKKLQFYYISQFLLYSKICIPKIHSGHWFSAPNKTTFVKTDFTLSSKSPQQKALTIIVVDTKFCNTLLHE